MNTITVDANTYRGIERYAKAHHLSINDVVKEALLLLFGNNHKAQIRENEEFQRAMAYMDTLIAKEGKSVPANENGIASLVEEKYL
ncbi:MAG: hypothetical protein J6K41_01445 [Paraprevotella sp.]|nr:hypothetical protein [Paraprevotella sp.]